MCRIGGGSDRMWMGAGVRVRGQRRVRVRPRVCTWFCTADLHRGRKVLPVMTCLHCRERERERERERHWPGSIRGLALYVNTLIVF